jgi:hypothetical protein
VLRRLAQFSRMRRSSCDSTSGSSLGSAITPADRTRQPGDSSSPDLGHEATHVLVKELRTGSLAMTEQIRAMPLDVISQHADDYINRASLGKAA